MVVLAGEIRSDAHPWTSRRLVRQVIADIGYTDFGQRLQFG